MQRNLVSVKTVLYRPSFYGDPIWCNGTPRDQSSIHLELYFKGGRFHLQVSAIGRGVFSFSPGLPHIDVFWETSGVSWEHYYATIARAFVLESMGIPCLHGNLVVLDGCAIGLIGTSTAGKSTLSASLCTSDARLVSDDLVVLSTGNSSGYVRQDASLRLWPDSVDALFGAGHHRLLPRLHGLSEKRVIGGSVGLAAEEELFDSSVSAIYLLDRGPEKVAGNVLIERLSPSESVRVLLQESMISDAGGAMGIEVMRFGMLTSIAGAIPVKRLSFPTGFDYLPAVGETLRSDLGKP